MISGDRDILNGVVLAGGKSARMGQDKGSMNWHGVKQREYIADLLSNFCSETFISCRDEQQITDTTYPLLLDAYTGIGSYGAILSAFQKNSNAAWLVVACDLPLIDEATLEYLISNRNKNAIATTFESPHDGLPEPLITIWEPAAYTHLLELLDEGYTCPRKALMRHTDVSILKAPAPNVLMNANTPEDKITITQIMAKQGD
jgi:molybdopterin-guanine dinucleotide biosynthesis protein A